MNPRPNRRVASSPSRRSPCPVACALDIVGDRWSLLVIRDLFLGCTRFKDFVASPEQVPTNVLADRLKRLKGQGIIRQIASADGTKHRAYELTPKGVALGPILRDLRGWGLRWLEGTEAKLGSRGDASGKASKRRAARCVSR
jgi:DNA-binding HxlR family transcriptional regulator